MARAQQREDGPGPAPTAEPPRPRPHAPPPDAERILALQSTAGNASVTRMLARQAVEAPQAGRHGIVLIDRPIKLPKKLADKGAELQAKLVVKNPSPKGNDTADSASQLTAVEHKVRQKAAALETEFMAGTWNLPPAALEQWAARHGASLVAELEVADVTYEGKQGKTGGPAHDDVDTPSVDLAKINVKLTWDVGTAVAELTFTGRLNALALLDEAGKAALESLDRLEEEAEKLVKEQEELAEVKARREATEKAAREASVDSQLTEIRKRRDAALKQVREADLDWDDYRRRTTEIMEQAEREVAKIDTELPKRLRAEAARLKAREEAFEKIVDLRSGRVRRLADETGRAVSKAKGWAFQKIGAQRMLKLGRLLARAFPFINAISLASDIYEFGKILLNWDKLKPGIGGKDGDGKGTGSGTPPKDKGSGGGPPGPADAPQPDAPPPAGRQPPAGDAKGPKKPTPDGDSDTGTADKPSGQGTPGAPPAKGTPPAPAGAPPGKGTDPKGKDDGPDTGKAGDGQGGKDGNGGKDGKGGDHAGDAGKSGTLPGGKAVGKPGGSTPGKGAGKDGAGDEAKEPKHRPKKARPVKAAPTGEPPDSAQDLFTEDTMLEITAISGITAGSKERAQGWVSIEVERDGRRYRVTGIPVTVAERHGGKADDGEWWVEIVMRVNSHLRLPGTSYVIRKGDKLVYTWEGGKKK